MPELYSKEQLHVPLNKTSGKEEGGRGRLQGSQSHREGVMGRMFSGHSLQSLGYSVPQHAHTHAHAHPHARVYAHMISVPPTFLRRLGHENNNTRTARDGGDLKVIYFIPFL